MLSAAASCGSLLVSRHQGAAAIDWRLALTIGIPGILVVAGWFFVHGLNARRDLVQRRREARIRALETAYIRLAKASNRPLTNELLDDLELFVSEIQLYGTPAQVEMMGRLVEAFKIPNNRVDFDPLLKDLRDGIREELALERLRGPVWWLRLGRKEKTERFRIVDKRKKRYDG